MKSTAQRRAERKKARSERLHGPPGYIAWLKAQPCRKCGRGPSEAHHDPTAARGGTWQDTSPLCTDCHTAGPEARHRMGHEEFWAQMWTDRESVNAEYQRLWRIHNNGLED